jgi:hypothetical protein
MTRKQDELLATLKAEVPLSRRKGDFFVRRAIYERGLTEEDVEWNRKLSRSLIFKETVHPEVEEERRKKWTAENS